MASLKTIVSIILIAVMVLNVVLFAFRVIGVGVFWLVIGVGALVTYVIFPKIRG